MDSPPVEAASPRVILKLDDLKQEADGDVHEGWKQAIALLDARSIPASIGVICEGLSDPTPTYIAWVAARQASGHEFWNHGLCHCRSNLPDGGQIREFRGPDYETQLHALTESQRLAKEHLGLTFTAFGAPYNSSDSLTAMALAQVPELKTWLYKDTDHPTALRVLERTPVNIEYPVHIPRLDSVQHYFSLHRDAAVLVIQGHPRSWADVPTRMQEFAAILDYLLGEGVEFVRIEDV